MGEKRFRWRWGTSLVICLTVSCVSLPRSFHALSYRNQTIFLDRHHQYHVGPLSSDWQFVKNKGPGISFRHKESKATIATEAVCGAAYEDLSLEKLSSQLLMGLKDIKKIEEEYWHLSGRDALYTKLMASLDGVSVQLNIVVIKKGQCQFDFLATALPQFGQEVSQDFENFVKGFDY